MISHGWGEAEFLPAGLKVATAIEHSSSLCLLHRMLQWQVCWTSVCLDARMAQLAGLFPATKECFRQWQVPSRGQQETLEDGPGCQLHMANPKAEQ